MSNNEFNALDLRLRNLETGMAVLVQQLDDHTEQDARQFAALGDQLEGLDEKIDSLLIQEAERRGALNAARATATKWSATVAAIVIAVAEAVRAWVI